MMRTLKIPKDGPLHRKLKRRLEQRVRMGLRGRLSREEKWRDAENRTLAYLPESEADAKRRARRDQGGVAYTTIQIPYTYSLLMSAHTYWTSVFFARNPIHQFSGRHGEGEMQVQATEALISYQIDVGRFMMPYFVWLYDTGKYGCGILGQYWERRKIHYGELVELQAPDGSVSLYQTTREVEGYNGNCAYNISPWDFVHDPRVSFKHFQKGEYCAVRCRLTWNDVVRRRDAGYYNDNVDMISDHSVQKSSDSQGSTALERPDFTSTFWEEVDENGQVAKKHPAQVVVWEVYVDLIPKEWEIGGTSYPQKWCFTVTEDFEIILGASPLGLVHGEFPIDVMEAEVEGYGLFSRGVPEIMESTQNTMDWLLNVHFYNVRAAMNNQFIVDPSKLVVKDVQNSGPGFIWRLRPEAYGTDIRSMFHQVQVQDVTRQHMADLQAMMGIGERVLGVNDQIMGALSNGSARKTATEVRATTGFGVNRLKTITEWMSACGFQPHAQKLLQTSQQMYDGAQKMRRVGSLMMDAGQQFIDVTPEMIAGQFDVVPVDGTLPVDRMAQANLWKEILIGGPRMSPQIQMGFDWTRIFSWTAQLAGLKNINNFKVQVVPDAQLAAQAQQGNVIPMPNRPAAAPAIATPGNSASTAAGLNALPGVGGNAG